MKFLIYTKKFFISFLLMVGMFVVYDGHVLSLWFKMRFLEKFVIHVVLKDYPDVESIIQLINTKVKKTKIKELTYLTKQQVYDEIRQNEEIKIMLDVLKENPFFDVLRIKFSSYETQEINDIMKVLNASIYTKSILYDYNLKSYLDRITKFQILWDRVVIILLMIMLCIIVLYIVNANNTIWLYPNMLVFTVVYLISATINFRVMNYFIAANRLIHINFQNIAVYTIIYIFTVLQNSIEKNHTG